jgi:hypothetical protein
MMGTGELTLTMPAIAVAEIVVVVGPRRRINVVATLRCVVTRIKAVGNVDEKATPGAADVAGKSTVTVSPAFAPKPFLIA